LCGDFDLEANRRFFFSSLLGEIGMPTWGSSGYEWLTAPEIWFDSAVIGTLGNLTSFSGPEPKSLATPERVAKFNGLTHVIRYTNVFSPVLIDGEYQGPARGAHSSSWARLENGEVMLVAPERRLDGRKGAGKFRDLTMQHFGGRGFQDYKAFQVSIGGSLWHGELILKRTRTKTVLVTEHFLEGKENDLSGQESEIAGALWERATSGSLSNGLRSRLHWFPLSCRRPVKKLNLYG
jgi:hypothetical protein